MTTGSPRSSSNMTLREKYQPVLQLVEDYSISGEEVTEADDMLAIRAVVETTYERDVILEAIKEVDGDAPSALRASIRVRNPDHTSQPSENEETLQEVAHKYRTRPRIVPDEKVDQPVNPDALPS